MHNQSILLIFLAISCLWSGISVCDNKLESNSQVDFSINRYKKDIDISFKRGTIKIENHFGDVHLKNTDANQVGISVVAQEIGKNPAIHELLINNTKNLLSFTVKYKESDLSNHNKKSVQWPIGRVDLVIFVPKDMTIDIETDDGAIDVRKTKNWIKAKSHTGKIDISNHYDIEAASVSGRIKVFPMSTKWEKGIFLSTKSSPIYAVIPRDDKVKLSTKTSGKINSRMDSPESWKNIDSNKFNAVLANYKIKSEMGDIFISPHD